MRSRAEQLTVGLARLLAVVVAGLVGGGMVIGLAVVLMALGGCAAAQPAPQLPEIRREYVPVPAELVKRCPWPKNLPKRRVLESNAARGACLEQYEGQLDAIGGLKDRKP